jgi:hypothetical protein
VEVSNPDEVLEICHLLNPSGCTMTLGSTEFLAETSTRGFPMEQKRTVPRAGKLALSKNTRNNFVESSRPT